MLRLLPRYPQKMTVQSMRNSLLAEGFEVTERTVQRDLNELSIVFPLVVDDRDKPYGWSWKKDAPSFSLPGLSIPEALALALTEKHMEQLLPAGIVSLLKSYFDAARQRLDAEPKPKRAKSWLDKVRTIPPTQPLISPRIQPEVHSTITESLLHERQVEIGYRKRGDSRDVTYRVHPLALIQRGPVLYLYCRIFDYPDFRTLAMHRISNATMLGERCKIPADFSLDEKVEAGIWGFGSGKSIFIELLFEEGYGDHLLEAPLSKDQKIEMVGGKVRVSATVPDTAQLRWWILGFCSGVEVLSPTTLRSEISKDIKAAAEKYSR